MHRAILHANPRRARLSACLLIACAAVGPPVSHAAGKGEPGPVFAVRVELADPALDLGLFRDLDLDVDARFEGWARLYLVREEMDKLRGLGYRITLLPPIRIPESLAEATPTEQEGLGIPTAYHTYETLTTELQAIAEAHPDLTRLYTLGQSAQGRELWMMKISRNPALQEDEPEVAFVAAMHGDEVVGKELCIELIHHLLDNYGSDSRVTDLVDGAEVWIMPSMNPDGTALGQRYNANGFDLNRNFPDWFADPNNTPAGRQPETQAVMAWVAANTITLSANYHGGALVANYPFDNNETQSNVESPTPDPDDAALHAISLTYAENNTPMFTNPAFPNGVTNGAAWYAIDGGMQDWSYTWYGKFDVTLEIGDDKWPPASTLPDYWDDNLESMLSYLERAAEGVRGLVTDAATGAPLAAEIRLDADPFPVYADPDVGDYHRIVLPGDYTLHVSAPGYDPSSTPVLVTEGAAARYDVQLQPLPANLQLLSARIRDGLGGNGWLDPGETVELALTLKNEGHLATAVGARLIPTGWYADVLQPDATYPDLPNQQAAESNTPHYTIRADPAVPPGHRIGLAVQWEADQGGGVSEPIFLDLGGPTCEVSSASDVPRSILDLQTTTSEILDVPEASIDEVRVGVDISHTYIGDLILTLRSPSGTEVVLHDRSGGGAHDIVGTYGVDLTSAESLSVLRDQSAGGTWALEVQDQAGGDTGALESWSLEICGRPVEASTPEMRLRGLSVEQGDTLLEWWTYPGLLAYRVYKSSDPGDAGAFVDATLQDDDPTDTVFRDTSNDAIVFYLVTGVGPRGEGPKGHHGE